MMSYRTKRNEIRDIQLTDFKEESNGFSVLSLSELLGNHFSLLSHPHRINFNQLILITEGSGYINIDSNQFEFSQRNLFTVGKGQVEYFEMSRSTKGYIIQFTEDYIHKYPGDLDWINNLKLFNPSAKPFFLSLTSMEHLDFLNLTEKIITEHNSEDDFAKDDIIVNLLKTFLLVAERIKRNRMGGTVTDIIDWSTLVEFKKKLEDNFHRSRLVNFYAQELNITQKKLNDLTTTFWGKSAKQVIEERVLLEIKRLLLYTNKTIKEIGLSLGFNDPTNFNKFFKKYSLTTPVTFRFQNNKQRENHISAFINHL